MMKKFSDKKLLQKARIFDLQALSEIYDRFSPELYRYALWNCNEPEMAEDCLSEVFRRLLSQLRQGKGPRDHLRAYLYRTAHNWLTDQYRKSARVKELPENQEFESPSNNPEIILEEQEKRKDILEALYVLTDAQRQIIILRYLEGWKLREIAVFLGKSVEAVKTMQWRALRSLERRLPFRQGGKSE